MPTETDRRPVGRPRTRPEGVRERAVYLTNPEFADVSARAAEDGISAAEWMRRTLIAASKPAKKAGRK